MTILRSLSSVPRRWGWLVAAALALSTAPLAAHDMWIEPTSFIPDAGKIIGVRLRVGQDFLGDPLPRDPALIEQFISVDSTGRKPVYGRDSADPAGLLRVAEPGGIAVQIAGQLGVMGSAAVVGEQVGHRERYRNDGADSAADLLW